MSNEAGAPIVARFRGTLGAFVLDAAFEAPMRGVTAVFGPSGCGKTTVLRCVAGLQMLRDGYLSIGGEVWQDGADFRPPYERSVGYVFQEASLFPHLSVRRNLLYGHRRAVRRGTEEATRFDDVVALLGMQDLLDRSPLRLSGGERQRVAVGRALLAQPRLLLMDEPLAGLDRLSKDEILPYLEALHTGLSIPILYVSHDIAEVERLADHLVLIQAGHVVACGPLQDLQADPQLPVARLPEASVALNATVTHYDPEYGLTTLSVDGGTIVVPGQHGAPGTLQRVRVRASDVSLARQAPGPQHDPQCSSRPCGGRRGAGRRPGQRRDPAGGGRTGRAPSGAGHPQVLGGARDQAGRSGPRPGQERRAGCRRWDGARPRRRRVAFGSRATAAGYFQLEERS